MTNEEILREITALPTESRQQIENLIASLRQPNIAQTAAKLPTDLTQEPFFGMWRNREDMADSTAWVRNLRQTAWRRQRG